MQNLRQVATGKGLSNVSKMDRIIWAEFGDKVDELMQKAALIKAGIKIVEYAGEESDGAFEFAEGRVVTEAHTRRERNPKLRLEMLRRLRSIGPLSCAVCECRQPVTDFGEAVFEIHHVVPLAKNSDLTTRIDDVALVCANCHRMIHRAISRTKRWLTMHEAKSVLFGSQAFLSTGPSADTMKSVAD